MQLIDEQPVLTKEQRLFSTTEGPAAVLESFVRLIEDGEAKSAISLLSHSIVEQLGVANSNPFSPKQLQESCWQAELKQWTY